MTRDDAQALDAADPLARFRDAFDLPRGVIYLTAIPWARRRWPPTSGWRRSPAANGARA